MLDFLFGNSMDRVFRSNRLERSVAVREQTRLFAIHLLFGGKGDDGNEKVLGQNQETRL
jgi:hypothetical protein